MHYSIFGLARNPEEADRIVARLSEEGFTSSEISVLYADKENRLQKKENVTYEKKTKAPEGAASGATIGGLIGGSIGLLAGIGSIAIPGLGAFIAAGPIVAALSGSAVGGALGLVVGSLVGLGVPEYEAKIYEKKLKSGNVLVSIHVEDSERLEEARAILSDEGATDITTSREKTGGRF